MKGKVCRCGFPLPVDWPPTAFEHEDAPGTFTVLWNAFWCAPCARTERIEP